MRNNLSKKLHFKLKRQSGEIINVYTKESEFIKLKKELDVLDKYREKIIVKFKGNEIPNDIVDPDNLFNQAIFEAEEIILIERKAGKTDWKK